jgi:hypothetical protein
MILRSQGAPRVSFVRVVKPTGWGGGYKRKPPTGVHKCLDRAEMKRVIASWG